MREKAEILFDAVTGIREELVEEAQDYVFRRRSPWRRYMPLAACLALAVCLGWFGLLFSGGMGGGNKSADSAPPAAGVDAAPEDPAPSDTLLGGEYGGGDGAEAPGCPPPEPVGRTFTARVVELDGDTLLVRPLPGGDLPAGTDRAAVSLEGLEERPDLQAGDKVEIVFTGDLEETYPLQITGVTAIRLAE